MMTGSTLFAAQLGAQEKRIEELEALLKEARYILENNRAAGDIWAGRIADRITAVLKRDHQPPTTDQPLRNSDTTLKPI